MAVKMLAKFISPFAMFQMEISNLIPTGQAISSHKTGNRGSRDKIGVKDKKVRIGTKVSLGSSKTPGETNQTNQASGDNSKIN